MGGLRRHAAASIVTAAAGILVALLATPLVIDHVGKAGYGVWTLTLAVVIWLTVLEAGAAPAVQRAVAGARGAGRDDGPVRVLWTTLAAYAAVGLALGGLLLLLAPVLPGAFDLGPALEEQAERLLRVVALTLPLGLVTAAGTNVLAGLERFDALALSALLGGAAYLGALVLLIGADAELWQLGWALVAQQAVLLAVRYVMLADVLRARPGVVGRRQAREMAAMTAQLQVSAVSVLVNSQTDKVVAGLVAPPVVVGHVGIAAQLAESGRGLAVAPLVPITTRLAEAEGAGDPDALRAELRRLDRLWVRVVAGGVVVGAACADPLVAGWLGSGYGEAAAFAAMLVVAYGVGLLPGVRAMYLRATARPQLEARTAVLLMVLNVAATVPLALAFGAPGVVGGTLAASLAGTAWFARRFRALEPAAGPLGGGGLARPLALALLAGAGGAAWGLGVVALIPPGWALPLVAAGAAAAFAAYLSAVLGVLPTPAGLRQLLAGSRGSSTSQGP